MTKEIKQCTQCLHHYTSKETMYNGKYILWDIVDVYEKLKGNWAVYGLEGYDRDGNFYSASMESYISNPIIIQENITDIELQEEHMDIKIDEMFTEFELILRESRAKAISLSSLLKDLNTLKNKVKELKTKIMKTPLQELMYYMEQNQYFIGNDLLAEYKKLLEKEKDLFCQFAKIYDDDLSRGIIRKVQDAFDETFRNNESAM